MQLLIHACRLSFGDCSAKDIWGNCRKHIPCAAYTRLDSRIAWRPAERLELSMIGQNLLQPSHLEFTSVNQGILASQVKRGFYGKATWRF